MDTAVKQEQEQDCNVSERSNAMVPLKIKPGIQAVSFFNLLNKMLNFNQPLKASLHEYWMAGDVDKEYTDGGNIRTPASHILGAWVLKADTEWVKNSFKMCVTLCSLHKSSMSKLLRLSDQSHFKADLGCTTWGWAAHSSPTCVLDQSQPCVASTEGYNFWEAQVRPLRGMQGGSARP